MTSQEGSVRERGFADDTLPRSNGSLVLDAPWEARVHALAVLAVEGLGREWDDFRAHLIATISAGADRSYWESWVIALEGFVAEFSGTSITGAVEGPG
jgi:hypothetical protein